MMATHAQQCAAGWTDGQIIQTHSQMMRLTLRIVAETLFGQAVGPEADALSEAMNLNVLAFRKLTRPWGWLRAIMPSLSNFRYLRARHRLINTLGRFISERRKSGMTRDDLLGRLLAARDAAGNPAMSERQLMDECVTLFSAGHETTANALTFTLLLLGKYPPIQKKLHEEIQLAIGSHRLPTIDDLDHLPYTRAVISESMRLYPPAWIQARQALAPCVIAGQTIARGDVVFVSQWITHRDQRWWSNPNEFKPERFLNDVTEGRPRWAYFPFGGGSRNCVGEAFAWTEAIIVLAALIQRWEFQSASNAALELEPGITLRPTNEVELLLVSRTRQSNVSHESQRDPTKPDTFSVSNRHKGT